MLGGLLALLSAATFGFNNASVRRGVLNASVLQGLAITVPIGVPLFLLAALVTGHVATAAGFSTEVVTLLAAAGVVHFVWGRYCNYRATKAIGGNLSGPFQQANLVVSLSLAIILLSETLSPLKVVGIVLVVLGAAVTVRARPNPAAAVKLGDLVSKKVAFEPRYLEGYSFALLSAVGYGVSPVLIRMALENASPGESLGAGLISYTAAAMVIGLLLLWPGQWRHVRSVNSNSAKWFTLSGILVFLSQMFRYLALSIAPVTVVAPIQATSAAFRVMFAWIINRDHEVFGLWVISGILISMLGVVALSLSIDVVLAYARLPDFLVEIAQWQWPNP